MPPRPPSASPTLSAPSGAAPPAFGARCASQDAPWTFGDTRIDAVLPGGALDSGALHEIKPRSYSDWSAAFVFAVRLAVRRLGPSGAQGARPTTLWCHTRARGNDLGRLYAPGLEALGLPIEDVIIVETTRAAEVLWAIEEGLGSRAVSLVIGAVDQIGLTPSRRLSLAAAAAGTPCLLLTAPDAAAAPAATTRWRVARAVSAAQGFDPAAIGSARLALELERCRGGSPLLKTVSSTVEWCDAARRFRVVAGLADRAPGENTARLRAG